MSDLDDGTYEVVVIDAEAGDDDTLALELAIASGPRRGDVVRVIARGTARSWVDVLASPATLTVVDGQPRVDFG